MNTCNEHLFGGNILDQFILHSSYKPTGDQPEAIDKLVAGVEAGYRDQTLLGVTGSGKNLYHGKYYRKGKPPDAHPCS